MDKVDALKTYFGSMERPVTNAEMIELRKADPKGFTEMATAAAEALGQKLHD